MKVAAFTMRRFQEHRDAGAPMVLGAGHPSVRDGRTLFGARVTWAGFVDRVLKSGHHSRKIGRVVAKGKWSGFPVFTLTLEERATCPSTCREWASCYGNKMNWSQRLLPGEELERRIGIELAELERQHPRGFVVRLHVLGDFYSPAYVRRWLGWLEDFGALRVFGYTAWPRDSEIGRLIAAAPWHRFAIRFSGTSGRRGAITVSVGAPTPPDAITCPAQTGKSDCCGTCALCWQQERPIAFLRH